VSRQSWSDAHFLGSNKMRYEAVLGQVLRDIRLLAGLALTDCVTALSAANLSQVENGLAVIKIETLVGLCDVLGVAPSDVLLIVEARLSGRSIDEQIAVSTTRLGGLLPTGCPDPGVRPGVVRNMRRQKADTTHAAVMQMQREGLNKGEIAERLGVTLRTVQRYWPKGE
jgi:transcriptional regulator with XRE-family HTH domain